MVSRELKQREESIQIINCPTWPKVLSSWAIAGKMDLTCWGSSLMRYCANFWSWSLWSLDKDSETGALRQTAEAWTQTHEHRHNQGMVHTWEGYQRLKHTFYNYYYTIIFNIFNFSTLMKINSLNLPTLECPDELYLSFYLLRLLELIQFKLVHSKSLSRGTKILRCGFWRGRAPPHGRTI